VRVGDVLDTFAMRVDPLLGQNFWFITYNPTYGRFFISDYYGGVYSFDPGDPTGTFRMETWAFAPVYDPYLNHPFGIATDNDSLFFLGHLEYDGWYVYGEALASYREVSPGVFAWTGDSLDLFSIAAAITYGMDYQTGTRDALWLVMSDGTSHAATLINPMDGTVRKNVPLTGLLDVPTGISYLPYTGELLLTDGKKVYRVDTMGNVVDAYYTPGNLPLYDLDVYEACTGGSTDPVVAYAVTPGDTLNTVHIVATGYYCDQVISVAERPKVERERVSLYVSGRTVRLRGADGIAYVYDLAGRRVGTFRASETFTFNRSGVFFVKAEDRVLGSFMDFVVREYEVNGKVKVRQLVKHPGAVVMIPVLPDGRIIYEKQYRFAVGDYIYELPAGTLEPGEDPLETAKRELMEETGYSAKRWRKLAEFYLAPG